MLACRYVTCELKANSLKIALQGAGMLKVKVNKKMFEKSKHFKSFY